MTAITIFHNPRCSKSRQTLALIEEQGVSPEIVLYLESTPDELTLKALVSKLGFDSAFDLARKKEADFKEQGLAAASEAELLKAMSKFPKLIERPIVVKGDKAVLGRPPENVLALLND